MNDRQILEIIKAAGRLKSAGRHCTIAEGRQESVADHSYRLALFAMLLCREEEFSSLDREKVLCMCLIHDLGEAFTGDIPTFVKTRGEEETEERIFSSWVESFPEPHREEWQGLLEEMKEQRTPEAKLYKALDKLEALISHNESDLSTWLPLEYDLQFTYGQKECAALPALLPLRSLIDEWTREKMEGEKKGGEEQDFDQNRSREP